MALVLPLNEEARLADLHSMRLLDTPSESRFDQIVEMAAELYGCPTSFISLVDHDRLYFKSKVGLEVDTLPREDTFCSHTILQDEPLIIPDTLDDPKFSGNPYVVNPPNARFYAGCPLKGPAGQNIGTLCVLDDQPHTMSDKDRDMFKRMAGLVEHEFGLIHLIETQQELLNVKDQLFHETEDARQYVLSLLPKPIKEPPVLCEFAFHPSSQLGGDLMGYHWLDGESKKQLAIYILDVCGHGIGASLMAASAWTAMRRGSFTECAFCDPAAVMSAMSEAFPMAENNGKFLTAWYGVYDVDSRTLRYAAGGHPPPVLFDAQGQPTLLDEAGIVVGVMQDAAYTVTEVPIKAGSRLYVCSDGAFEIRDTEEEMLGFDRLVELLADVQSLPDRRCETVYQRCRSHALPEEIDDDFTLLEVDFI
jgi:sigma-B regulation protein RsbU (phosphoserine phosphatase)